MTHVELSHLPADATGLADWAKAALANRPAPPSLPGMRVPKSLDDFVPVGERFDVDARRELAQLLEEALTQREPHVHVVDAVRSLEHPEAAMVIAGQQPGFLGGPLYNVYKAIHAIRLARALAERWGVPVVPTFWNHADDHDIAEVHHLWVRNPNLDLRKVSLAGMSSGRLPFSRIHFDAETHRLESTAELLRQNLWDCAAREPAIELFLPRDGETFASAFTRVLLELFGEDGLVVVEPDWIRRPLSSALAHVVVQDVGESLEEGSRRLEAAGSTVAIDPATAALVFRIEDGKRRALRLAPGGFRFDGEEGMRTAVELAAEIVVDPEEFSPGALLRPLVQDLALPSVAYVGGWGELAYHAQLPPLRDRAGVERTAFVPRLSATVVDPPAQQSLAKLELSPSEALAARGRLGEDETEETSNAAADSLRALADQVRRDVVAQRGTLAELDRGLAGQLKKVADQAATPLEKLAQKADRVAANASGRGRRHHRRLNSSLFPRELPQERVQGTLEVVGRFGTDWLRTVTQEVDPLPTEHLLLSLEEGDDA